MDRERAEPRLALQGVAVALAVDPDGPLFGIALIGPAGIGKSSLAISLVETCPWRRSALVADDVIDLQIDNGKLIGASPNSIAGLVEVRGFGLVQVRTCPNIALNLLVDCMAERPARIAEITKRSVGATSIQLPLVPFWLSNQVAHEPSSRLRLIVRSILSGQSPS